MPKLTILLINTENMGHGQAMAVSGYSGKLYGYAEFDKAMDAHVFRVPEDGIRCPDSTVAKWDGDMDLDIAKGMHRRLQRWKIRAEVVKDAVPVPREDDSTGVDEAALAIRRSALTGACAHGCTPGNYSSSCPDHGDGFRSEGDRVGFKDAELNKIALSPVIVTGSVLAAPIPDLNLHPKILEKMVREENEKGANIVIDGERTKVKLRAALTEHYSKQAA